MNAKPVKKLTDYGYDYILCLWCKTCGQYLGDMLQRNCNKEGKYWCPNCEAEMPIVTRHLEIVLAESLAREDSRNTMDGWMIEYRKQLPDRTWCSITPKTGQWHWFYYSPSGDLLDDSGDWEFDTPEEAAESFSEYLELPPETRS